MKVIALVPAYDLDDPATEFGGEKLLDLACQALTDSGRVDQVVVHHTPERDPALPDAELLVVHDPSRALIPIPVIRSVIDVVACGDAQAAVPAEPVTDTIKVAEPADVLNSTWDRGRLRSIQSPLCCRTELVAGLRCIPSLGDLPPRHVRLVPGDPRGMRLRSRFDMLVAEVLTSRASGDD